MQISGKSLRLLLSYVVMIIICLVIAFPFYWLTSTSLKGPNELGLIPPTPFPLQLDIHNYKAALEYTTFPLNVRNSIIVSLSTAFACVLLGSFAAYAFCRIRMKGYKLMLGFTLLLAMLPGVSVIGPLYQMFISLRLLNTYLALILPYTAFNLPFTIWYLSSFFKALPRELEDVAMVDGCTPFQAMIKIVFPVAAPGLVAVGILSFVGAWNEFLFALTLTQTDAARTGTVGVVMFQQLRSLPWGPISAASTVMSLPVLILVLIGQRWLLRSLVSGVIKG